MKFNTTPRRLAATGFATALAAAALTASTVAPATAATGTTTYSCASPLGTFAIPVSLDLTGVPAEMLAGEPLDAGLPASMVFTAPADLAAALSTYGLTALSSPDFDLPLGNSAVPVRSIAMSGLPVPGLDGSLALATAGVTEAYQAPEAGTHALSMPSTFTLVPTITGLGEVPVPCTTTTPAELDTVTVVKNDSATTAKATKRSFVKGTVAKIRAKVTDSVDFINPTGRVVAKKGTKTYKAELNDNGVAVIKLGRKLPVGKNKFTVKYLGSGYHNGSQAASPVVVKVVR